MIDNVDAACLALRELADSFTNPPPPWLSGYGFRMEGGEIVSLYIELRGDPGAEPLPSEIGGFKIVALRRKEKESVDV